MKEQTISESGVVNMKGRLMLPMDRLNEFFANHKGMRLIATFEAVIPGSTAAQQSYYYRYVIPTIVAALKKKGTLMTEDRADRWLMEEYPGGRKPSVMPLIFARQLNQLQMAEYLEWLKQYAAENLNVYIEDPSVI